VNRFAAAFATLAIVAGWIVDARGADTDVFAARCVVCHQKSAQGVPSIYPPLADSIGSDVRFKDGRDYLIHVVIGGMTGPVVVKGMAYNGLMPQFSQLTDAEIAAVLNKVLRDFNAREIPKNFAAITAGEVKHARATPLSPADLARERTSLMKELQRASTADETAR
jgi:cytochrome c5